MDKFQEKVDQKRAGVFSGVVFPLHRGNYTTLHQNIFTLEGTTLIIEKYTNAIDTSRRIAIDRKKVHQVHQEVHQESTPINLSLRFFQKYTNIPLNQKSK